MPRAVRDPVSELFDSGARVLLERAYAARGGWAGTRLADPGPRHAAYFASLGIDVAGPDNASTAGGHMNAYTRWGRAFTRSLYYQHKWYSGAPRGGWRRARRTVPRRVALEVEWGRRMPALGVIPAGRAVRVRTHTITAARKFNDRQPPGRQKYDAAQQPAGRFSRLELRDWQ
jgi:hypothetical protein